MKTDISRLSFNELKHFLGVQLQMGRVQLDSDWNEQSELLLRLLQRAGNDVKRTGSPNNGFLVDDRILLDAMDSRAHWAAEAASGDPDPRLFVDYFDHRTGRGSLTVEGAIAVVRTVGRPIDLSELREVVFAAKGTFASHQCVFFLESGTTRMTVATAEDATQIAGWRIFRADNFSAPTIDLTAVEAYGFESLDKTKRYRFDFIKADLPIRRTLVPTVHVADFEATPPGPSVVPELSINDDDRVWRSTVLEVTGAQTVSHTLPAVEDLTRVRRLFFAVKTDPSAAPFPDPTIVDAAANDVTLTGTTVATVNGWEIRAYDVPQTGPDWSQIASVKWEGLTPATRYFLAPALMEMDLDRNLVIMGGDGTSEGAGRFYADGLAAVKESHETYFSQADLPAADPAPLAKPAEGKTRIDLAYLDLWERPITYLEDPEVRELALEGPDTCTRNRLVAQVRILTGTEGNGATPPEPPLSAFAALPRCGRGTLTTKDKPAAALDPCADPCEPEIAGTFVGQDNLLYRVEVHRAGGIGAAGDPGTAWFKWSRENGAVASALIADAQAGAFAVKVEKPELFRVGDLIEIADDLSDLITGPYTDRRQTRGELRRIVAINLQQKTISWEDATASDPQFHAALPRRYGSRPYHAKVRRWDGIAPVTSGDISLDDGVVIEFGGQDFIPCDYWVFATRVLDRSVERLVEAPPRGPCHNYLKLATIRRTTSAGQESVVVDDCRPVFSPLTSLKAAEVAFDPGSCITRHAGWDDVGNVQEAIDAICRLDPGDVKLHNRYLHGYGVVCGLKVKCNQVDRSEVIVEKGYALDCEGCGIRVQSELSHDVVAEADAQGLLDASGDGQVCLTITRGAAQDALIAVEPHVPLGFWDSVLEGTLIKDFYEKCIESLLNFLKARFLPFPATSAPPPDSHKRAVTALNLLYQLANPSSGRNIFVSDAEHTILHDFYVELRDRIQSETFCGMFDNARPFPTYPFNIPPGIETAFGLLATHRRLRVHPNGRFVYSCGAGNAIHVYDLDAREVVEVLVFPGGTNIEVKDVAFAASGNAVHAVGILGNKDSVFATATIAADGTHSWGPTTVVCDLKFVSLATSPAHPGNLYAIGKAHGLYVFPDPTSISLTPSPSVTFNATGQLVLSSSGDTAFAARNTGLPVGSETPNFDQVVSIDLNNLAAGIATTYAVSGVDEYDDVEPANGFLYVTGNPAPGHTKTVWAFGVGGGPPVATIDVGTNTPTKLASVPGTSYVLVTLAQENQAVRIDRSTHTLDPDYRVPLQIIPIDIAVAATGAGPRVCALNLIGTVSVIDPDVVIAPPGGVTLPDFTADPTTFPFADPLGDYRQEMIDAYEDIVKGFFQYLKDCFCDHFLIDCPECDQDDKIYLGAVDVRNRQVYNICNFTKRHYVKSFRTYGYWLSTFPVLPLLKRAFGEFCCMILPTS